MNKPTLEELCQPLNVDLTDTGKVELYEEKQNELYELKEELEETKDELEELKDKLGCIDSDLEGLISHFKGFFNVDQALNSPMSEFYNDMEDMAKDVVKTLKQLKSEIQEMNIYGIEYARYEAEDEKRYFKFNCPFLSSRVEIDVNEYEELCLTFRNYHINTSTSVIRIK